MMRTSSNGIALGRAADADPQHPVLQLASRTLEGARPFALGLLNRAFARAIPEWAERRIIR